MWTPEQKIENRKMENHDLPSTKSKNFSFERPMMPVFLLKHAKLELTSKTLNVDPRAKNRKSKNRKSKTRKSKIRNQ